jgi:hypothetical protein
LCYEEDGLVRARRTTVAARSSSARRRPYVSNASPPVRPAWKVASAASRSRA